MPNFTTENDNVKLICHDSNISSNIQYSSYKSCKDVLKDIRVRKINSMLTNLSSQSPIVKSLWNKSFNENIKHWYTSFQNLPKNIYNFSTRYIKNLTSLCKFCLTSQTLQHVVWGCKVYLPEGRYNWRHDSILKNLVTYLRSICSNLKYYVDISWLRVALSYNWRRKKTWYSYSRHK